MSTVLVLGAGGNAGMNFIKSLRRSGHPYRIVGCDVDPYNLAAAPCDERVLLEPASAGGRLERLQGLIDAHGVDLVHAQPDPEVEFLARHADVLQPRVFGLDAAVWQRAADKLGCQTLWSERLGLGFPCAALPRVSAQPESFAELVGASGRVWMRAIRGAGSRAALPVTTLEQAEGWARYWQSRGLSREDFMLAEYLDGPEYAVQTLWNRGELLHAQARQRLVYFFGNIMPSGQSSTPAVAVTVHEREVYDTAYAAIRALDPTPHGIYCADLKRDHGGRVVPMEVNYGRFFTTSDFFAALDVNTPHAYVQLALGARVEPRVECIREAHYWLRGLDREPVLTRHLPTLAGRGQAPGP